MADLHRILFFALIVSFTYAQKRMHSPNEIDRFPIISEYGCSSPEDGLQCFNQKLVKHFKTWARISQEMIDSDPGGGRVFVQLSINSKGQIQKVATRSLSEAIAQMTKQVFEAMPPMDPARIKGKKVGLVYSFPIYIHWEEYQPKITRADQLPRFSGCEETSAKAAEECLTLFLLNHIRKNFQYPSSAMRNGISGKVVLELVFGADGTVRIDNYVSPHPLLTKEAQRLIDMLPSFLPAKKEGVAVPYSMEFPISFALTSRFH